MPTQRGVARLYVAPDLAPPNPRYRRKVNFVARGQNDERLVARTDRADVIGRQLRLVVPFATVMRNTDAPFARRVAHVVRLRTVEQVARPNAGAIVTVMAGERLRPSTVLDKECDAIRATTSRASVDYDLHERTARIIEVCPRESPATTELFAKEGAILVDLCPKTLCKRVFSKMSRSHALRVVAGAAEEVRPSAIFEKKRNAMRLTRTLTTVDYDTDLRIPRATGASRPQPATPKSRYENRPATFDIGPKAFGQRTTLVDTRHGSEL